MSWFTYYKTIDSKDPLRPSVRRSLDKFTPRDKILKDQWLSADVSGFDINKVLNSNLELSTSNFSYKVVYHDDNIDGQYTVVDSLVDQDERIYFKAAEDHEKGIEIPKRYFIYYRDNNLGQIVYDEVSDKHTLLGTPLAQTYILDEYVVTNNFVGHYCFSFLNSDLDWSNGFSSKIGSVATLVFSGPNITLYGNTGPDYGSIKITINPISNDSFSTYEPPIQEVIDLYSQSEQKDAALYTNLSLNYRDYLMKIEVVNNINIKSSKQKVYISKAGFLFPIYASVSDEQLYEEASFNFAKVSNSKKFTLQNLKPGKNYLLTVRAKNSDINVNSDFLKTLMFTVPDDNTIPSVPENLFLYASFLNVMFRFDSVADLDISKYQYELYKDNQITQIGMEYFLSGSQTPYLTGFSASNVFTVAVDENTVSINGTISPVPYYGRVRSVDTTGNVGEWTDIVKSGDTPLIDEQVIGSLTASKITAGTIGSHTITLSGSNSIIQSSTYETSNQKNGWYIDGNGEFSLGGPDGINYDGQTINIGSDVQVTANLSADSITVGSGLNTTLNINDSINNGNGGMTVGNPAYNYWYADGKFSVGGASSYVTWNGSTLTVRGSISLDTNNYWNSNGTFKVGNASRYVQWDGSTLSLVGGSISLNTNNYWNSNGTFKVGNATKYMRWDGTNLEITGRILGGTTMQGSITSTATISGGTIQLGNGTIRFGESQTFNDGAASGTVSALRINNNTSASAVQSVANGLYFQDPNSTSIFSKIAGNTWLGDYRLDIVGPRNSYGYPYMYIARSAGIRIDFPKAGAPYYSSYVFLGASATLGIENGSRVVADDTTVSVYGNFRPANNILAGSRHTISWSNSSADQGYYGILVDGMNSTQHRVRIGELFARGGIYTPNGDLHLVANGLVKIRGGAQDPTGVYVGIDSGANLTCASFTAYGTKNFRIPHPILPEKSLVHSSIEGPSADLLYRGTADLIDGMVTINIDQVSSMHEGTFAAISKNPSCYVSNETDWDPVSAKIDGNILTIKCKNTSSNSRVSWMVMATRNDESVIKSDYTDEFGNVIVEPDSVF
jgi:hypothetical protein